jgi:penicillin-binding protein 1B
VIGSDGKALKAFPLEVTQVASPENVYQLDRLLVSVMEHGTGRPARALLPADLVVAGKSGTSSDYRDSWFAGFSGNDLVVVWVGYDDNEPTGFTGSVGALPVWARVMAGLGPRSWDSAMPESLIEVHIDFDTGLRALPGCSDNLVAVAVPAGTELPAKPGCGFPEASTPGNNPNPLATLKDRAEHWLQGLVH